MYILPNMDRQESIVSLVTVVFSYVFLIYRFVTEYKSSEAFTGDNVDLYASMQS